MSDITEGRANFSYPTLEQPVETWYQIHGDLKSSSTGRPLFLLHGGPGMAHYYISDMARLHTKYGVTVIFYDQVGCGNSTHLKHRRNDHAFWTIELFIAELENLADHLGISEFDILGHSWGGMLGADYATRQPSRLRRLIISNSPASMKLWILSCNEWRAELPRDVDETLEKYEKAQDYDAKEYQDAMLYFYAKHMCRKKGDGDKPFPDPVMKTLDQLEEDNTVYYSMNGPSEFTVIGNLKSWSLIGKLENITNPTLVINGEYDEGRNVCVEPYARDIKGAEWRTFKDASHCVHIEHTEEYCDYVFEWMKKH